MTNTSDRAGFASTRDRGTSRARRWLRPLVATPARRAATFLCLGFVLLSGGAAGIIAVLTHNAATASVVQPAGTGATGFGPAVSTVTPVPCPTEQAPITPGHHETGSRTADDLMAADQSGDGRSVLVDDAVLTAGGYLVVHDDDCGQPGRIIGVSALLTPGEHRDLAVRLTTPLTTSSQVFLMLHAEDNGNTTFDYPDGDYPITFQGQIVVVPLWVTIRP